MITVNGQVRDLPEGAAVADVVAQLLPADAQRGVAVAVNGEVVRRADWPTVRLSGGDRVEVLAAVQGG